MPRAARRVGTGRAAPIGGEERAATLAFVWSALLEEVAALAAHEIKGALNGVSINLEVIRARAAQPGAAAASVTTFADNAASQLELTVRLVEGLLALARAPRESADLAGTLSRIAALLDPVARVAGGGIAVEADDDLAGRAVADAGITRAVLAAVLLEIARDGRLATCRVGGPAQDGLAVRVRCADGQGAPLPARVAPLSLQGGIRIVPDPEELILVFPPAAGMREEA